jgi:N,N-dimethylformamidase
MLKILGYCDRLSVAPGERVRFMVSCTGAPRYRSEVVRIIHGDANPAGPGLKLEPVATPITGEYPGRVQPVDAGSYLRVADHERLRALASFTVLAMIWPTTPGRGHQALIGRWSPGDASGFALEIRDGELALTVDDRRGGVATVRSGKKLLRRRWYRWLRASIAATVWSRSCSGRSGRRRASMTPLRSAKPSPPCPQPQMRIC